jgi:hypothetical protein
MQPVKEPTTQVDRKPARPSNGAIHTAGVEPRTIHDLAEEHRKFLASLPNDLEDVELPPDR